LLGVFIKFFHEMRYVMPYLIAYKLELYVEVRVIVE